MSAGQWADASSGARFPVRNPATGELLAELPDMGESAAQQAVESAAQSLATTPPLAERRVWLAEIVRALAAPREELARIITLEQGKPLKESLVEVDYAAGFFRFLRRSPRSARSAHARGAESQFPAAGVEQRVLADAEPLRQLRDGGEGEHSGFADARCRLPAQQ